MPEPINLAAIDAGSNAIRLTIARVESPSKIRLLKMERHAVRLGRHVFTQQRFDRETLDEAVRAFQHFRTLMDMHDVQEYRAVATSAAREARNQGELIERVYESSGIRLEVIDGAEEARLVRRAVKASAAGKLAPELITDLGGGSLEISLLKSDVVEESVALPIGTVRLMETFDMQEAITPQQMSIVKSYILSLLRRYLPLNPLSPKSVSVACGGNAEALARIAPGQPHFGVSVLDVQALRRKLPQIVALSTQQRMRMFCVREDRADVMGIAAIVFATLGRWWSIERLLVPAVGVREGILNDLLRVWSGTKRAQEDGVQAEVLLSAARRYGSRLNWDFKHAEKVRLLALSLFDQLRPLHKMGPSLRLILELAALLHDIGHAVRDTLHYKHGEYLIRHGALAGLEGSRRNMIACIVRFHGISEPDPEHKLFTSFPRKQQEQIRTLVALLRMADAFDWDHRQMVADVQARLQNGSVFLGLRVKHSADLIFWAARQRAGLFEDVFDRQVVFREIR